MTSTRLFAAIIAAILAFLSGIACAQQLQASDFSHCLRSDDGKPVCFHRRTNRLTIVDETTYQAVVGGSAPSSSARPPGSFSHPSDKQSPQAGSAAARPGTTTTTVLAAGAAAQSCPALQNWIAAYLREFPDNILKSQNAYLNLFRDEYFVPHIGAPYLTLTTAQLNQVQNMIGRCRLRGGDNPALPLVLRALRPSIRDGLRDEMLQIANGLQWRSKSLEGVADASITPRGFQTLNSLELEGRPILGPLWPSEQRSFYDAVTARRKTLNAAALRSLTGKSSAGVVPMETLAEFREIASLAKEDGQEIRLKVDSALAQFIDRAFAEAKRLPPTDEGRQQFDEWRKKLEADLAAFPGYQAVIPVSARLDAELQAMEMRISVAALEPGGSPSLGRLERIDGLRRSSDAALVERARGAFTRDLSAIVKQRLEGMPNFAENRAGLAAFSVWRTQLEKDLERYQGEEVMQRAFASLAELAARLLSGSQAELVNERVPPSPARLLALREVAQIAKDPAVAAQAKVALEREVTALVANWQEQVSSIPATREGLQKLSSAIEAFRAEFESYSGFQIVGAAQAAAQARRDDLSRQIDLAEIRRLAQATPSFDSLNALGPLATSPIAEVSSGARTAIEAMVERVLDQEIAAVPPVGASLEGTATLARWASQLKQRLSNYNNLQVVQRGLQSLAKKLQDQREKSIEPFKQSLQTAFSRDTFNQAKQVIEHLPKDIVEDLPKAFEDVYVLELRAWLERKGVGLTVTDPKAPVTPNSPGATALPTAPTPPAAGATADPFGGLLAPGPKTSAPFAGTRSSPQPVTEPPAPPLPAPKAELLQRAINGTSPLTAEGLLFFGGIASDLVERCSVLSGSPDRAELARLLLAVTNRLSFGTNYSSRDIYNTVQGNIGDVQVFAAGVEFGRLIDCQHSAADALAQKIAEAWRKQSQGADGGQSQFVRTCSEKFSKQQCQCLAQMAQSVFPDIHQTTYNREIIRQLINSSPVVAFQMALACKIGNY